jgi:hypothetical protein
LGAFALATAPRDVDLPVLIDFTGPEERFEMFGRVRLEGVEPLGVDLLLREPLSATRTRLLALEQLARKLVPLGITQGKTHRPLLSWRGLEIRPFG